MMVNTTVLVEWRYLQCMASFSMERHYLMEYIMYSLYGGILRITVYLTVINYSYYNFVRLIALYLHVFGVMVN